MGVRSGAAGRRAHETRDRTRSAEQRPWRARGLAVLAALALCGSAACSTGSGGDPLRPAGEGRDAAQQFAPSEATAPGTRSPTTSSPSASPFGRPSTPPPRPSGRPTGPLPKPTAMAALGDSITRGYDACSVPLKDCPSKSWATGDDVDSQAKRLGLPREAVHNDARTGARMRDLAEQARAAVGQRVDYVTILMGANDACRDNEAQMTSVADFERQLREGLTVLREGLPGVRVLVVSIPDLARLWEVARGERMARGVWSAGICQTMLADPESTKVDDVERRQRVRDRVLAFNDVLRRVCGEWPAQCRYDGGAVNAHRFTKGDLSHWDWFHPSGQGQKVLADLTTEAGFRWQG